MTAAEKIERICRTLEERGEPGSYHQVARLLGVAPSTVSRWAGGESTPRGKQAESLDLLYRTVVAADHGNPDAIKILGAVLGAAGAGLLGMGVGGVLIAAGLGWLLGEHTNGGTDSESDS